MFRLRVGRWRAIFARGGTVMSVEHYSHMTDLRYTVVIEPDDGAFSVRVPAFPEIFTFGETHEQALEMAQDAICLSLEYRTENGLTIPAVET